MTGTEERLATGDAVNVAARLEQAAQPGEILLGAETRALVRDAVVVEAVEPLELKGKAAPVEAYRLVVGPGRGPVAPPRRRDGRARARAGAPASGDGAGGGRRLVPALHRARCRRRGEVAPRRTSSSPASTDATVVRGTCLSYGEGITYWPVVEVLKQLLGAAPEERLAELGLDAAAARGVQAVLGDGRRRRLGRGDRLGDAAAARGGRCARAARRRARRHPLGRGGVPRPRRPRRRPEPRCADPAALHGAARAARPAARAGAAAS